MPFDKRTLDEKEKQVIDLVSWESSRKLREAYLSKMDEIEELESELLKRQAEIKERESRIQSTQNDIAKSERELPESIEKARKGMVEELVVSGTIPLYATKKLMQDELDKAHKDKEKALANINSEVNKKKETALDDLQKEIETNIATINDASNNMLGERLSRLIDNSLDRNKISLKYTDLNEINERLQYLNKEAVNLDVSAAADIDGVVQGITKKLNFRVQGKMALLYLLGACIVIYFMYKEIFPIVFLGLMFLSYLYIRNTSKLYSVKLETKSIEDNMEEVTEARNREIERIAETDRRSVNEIHNPRIYEYEANLRAIDVEIRNEEDRIRREANPDVGRLASSLQSKIQDKHVEVNSISSELAKSKEEYLAKSKLLSELIDSIDNTVTKTWESYFNFSLENSDGESKPVTTILPELVPLRLARDEQYKERGIEYFTIPRTNALFVYKREDYNEVLKWAYMFITGIVANTKVSSILIDVNEKVYNSEIFRPLDYVENCFRTNATKFTYDDFCRANASLIEERGMDYSKREKGLDGYNWDALLIDAPTVPYKFLFNFEESKVISNIVDNTSGSSLADIGVYTYNFISIEELSKGKYEEVLQKLDKYKGTKYLEASDSNSKGYNNPAQFNTIFSVNGFGADPLPAVILKRNLDSLVAKNKRK